MQLHRAWYSEGPCVYFNLLLWLPWNSQYVLDKRPYISFWSRSCKLCSWSGAWLIIITYPSGLSLDRVTYKTLSPTSVDCLMCASQTSSIPAYIMICHLFPLSPLTYETKGFAFLIHFSVLRNQHNVYHIALVNVVQPHS